MFAKEQALSLGRYPALSLKEARAGRDQACKLISGGKNPAFEKSAPRWPYRSGRQIPFQPLPMN
jgi:hypothetical protein